MLYRHYEEAEGRRSNLTRSVIPARLKRGSMDSRFRGNDRGTIASPPKNAVDPLSILAEASFGALPRNDMTNCNWVF